MSIYLIEPIIGPIPEPQVDAAEPVIGLIGPNPEARVVVAVLWLVCSVVRITGPVKSVSVHYLPPFRAQWWWSRWSFISAPIRIFQGIHQCDYRYLSYVFQRCFGGLIHVGTIFYIYFLYLFLQSLQVFSECDWGVSLSFFFALLEFFVSTYCLYLHIFSYFMLFYQVAAFVITPN